MNYNEFKEFLLTIDKTSKPTLLLHSCCAPCSTHVLWLLKEYFTITILYDNPNIYPETEYNKRVEELARLLKEDEFKDINLITSNYHHETFLSKIDETALLGEGSKRCYLCYELRLKNTAEYAIKNHFDYYTTTLSISPYKNSIWINEIGIRYETENTKFLYSNFKKEEGYKHSLVLSKKYALYRQAYCGCEFSMKEMENKHQG